MTRVPLILYFWLVDDNPVQEAKLDGIRRYAAARRWVVDPVHESLSGPGRVQALLRERRPIGCIVESAGGKHYLPRRLFGDTPVVYLDMPAGLRSASASLRVSADDEAVARAAFRELSAGRPASLAVVEYEFPICWSRRRSRTFRAAAVAEKRPCFVFSPRTGERREDRADRLARWLATLPHPCGIFAVNDETGAEVASARRAAGLSIPHDIALVGVDDSARYCEASDPPFTSIRLDFERAGFLAARMLGETASAGAAASFGPLLAIRRKSTGGRGRREKFVLDAVEIIRREACDGLTARDLAARFRVSRNLFDLRFREAVGHSALDEILHVRVERACTLLAQTDTAIGAIPALCGFRCDRTLDALFRSRFGMSMRAWRTKHARPWRHFAIENSL